MSLLSFSSYQHGNSRKKSFMEANMYPTYLSFFPLTGIRLLYGLPFGDSNVNINGESLSVFSSTVLSLLLFLKCVVGYLLEYGLPDCMSIASYIGESFSKFSGNEWDWSITQLFLHLNHTHIYEFKHLFIFIIDILLFVLLVFLNIYSISYFSYRLKLFTQYELNSNIENKRLLNRRLCNVTDSYNTLCVVHSDMVKL